MEEYHIEGTFWLDGEPINQEKYIKLPAGTVFTQAVDQPPEVGFCMSIDFPWGQSIKQRADLAVLG